MRASAGATCVYPVGVAGSHGAIVYRAAATKRRRYPTNTGELVAQERVYQHRQCFPAEVVGAERTVCANPGSDGATTKTAEEANKTRAGVGRNGRNNGNVRRRAVELDDTKALRARMGLSKSTLAFKPGGDASTSGTLPCTSDAAHPPIATLEWRQESQAGKDGLVALPFNVCSGSLAWATTGNARLWLQCGGGARMLTRPPLSGLATLVACRRASNKASCALEHVCSKDGLWVDCWWAVPGDSSTYKLHPISSGM